MALDNDAELMLGAYQVKLRLNENVSSVVIILAGIGSDFSKDPEFDFQGVGKSFFNHSFVYVKDNSRSWYTNPHGWMDLVDFIQDLLPDNTESRITLLGSSMGGAGVLRLAKYVKADRVVAISPRSTLSTDFDIRNIEIVNAVENPELLDYFPAAAGVEYIVLFSIDDYEDTLHVARLPFTSYWVRGGHNVAYTFKKLNLLDVLFEALCAPVLSIADLGFNNSNLSTFDYALQRNNTNFELAACDESIMPEYLFDSWYQKKLLDYSASQCKGHLFFPMHYLSRVAGVELERYLFYGWSYLEGWGVWGIGPVHTLGFQLLDHGRDFDVHVNIMLAVFKPNPEYEQHIKVLLNGDAVFDGFLSNERCLLTFPAAAKDNSIVILTKNHISPAECDIAGDDRSLSVGVEEVFLKPVF